MKPPPFLAVAAPEKQRRKGGHAGAIKKNPAAAAGSTRASPHEDEEGGIASAVGGPLHPKAVPGTMAVLLQNCDLPPPQKLFGPDDLLTTLAHAGKPNFFSSSPIKPRPYLGDDHEVSGLIRDDKDHHPWVEHQEPGLLGDRRAEKDTGGLLTAMRLSQTRAREAEAKASQLGKTTERMALLLLDESMRLHAYRHWVKLLQAEIATLEKRRRSAREGVASTTAAGVVDPAADTDDDTGVVNGSGGDCACAGGSIGVGPCTGSRATSTWVAWAVVLAVAGVGLAVGCKYLF